MDRAAVFYYRQIDGCGNFVLDLGEQSQGGTSLTFSWPGGGDLNSGDPGAACDRITIADSESAYH